MAGAGEKEEAVTFQATEIGLLQLRKKKGSRMGSDFRGHTLGYMLFGN